MSDTNEANTFMMTPSADNTPIRAGADTGARPGSRRDPSGAGPGAGILANLGRLGLAAGCALALSACVTPQEQRAMDHRQCYGFGFEAETDGFAECMMGLSQQRTQIEAERSLQLRSQLAAQNRQREAQQDLYKALSLQRSGDKSYRVCGASYEGGWNQSAASWYGANCRSR